MPCRPAVCRCRFAGLAGLILSAALVGCGGVQAGSVAAGAAGSASGRQVFASQCSFCHSLDGHPTRRQQGGDLSGYRLSRAVLLEFTREMPVKRRLTRAELNAVVGYVARIGAGARR